MQQATQSTASASAAPTDAGQPSQDRMQETAQQVQTTLDQHPELVVAAGFGAGFLVAKLIKRLGNG